MFRLLSLDDLSLTLVMLTFIEPHVHINEFYNSVTGLKLIFFFFFKNFYLVRINLTETDFFFSFSKIYLLQSCKGPVKFDIGLFQLEDLIAFLMILLVNIFQVSRGHVCKDGRLHC